MATDERLHEVYAEIVRIEEHVEAFVKEHCGALVAVHPDHRASAENLLQYVALRQLDLRRLQLELGELGLSSLGRCEGHVRSSLRELRRRLEASLRLAISEAIGLSRADGERILHAHTRALLGPQPRGRHVSIMVTADETPASEPAYAELLDAGMDVLRLNTAHGSPSAWRETALVARAAAARLGRNLSVHFDLQGPKIRTAPMYAPGPAVVRFRPEKDVLGRVVRELCVPVISADAPSSASGLRVPAAWLAGLRVGDVLETRDSRDRRRQFHVAEVAAGAATATLVRTCYLTPQCVLTWLRDGEPRGTAPVVGIPSLPGAVLLQLGDPLQLWLDGSPCEPGVRSSDGHWVVPPRVGLVLDGTSVTLAPEQRVLFDDGKIEAVIESVRREVVYARVVRTAKPQVKLRAEKGVNFPDSELVSSALSDRDREVLEAVLELADVVAISFVRGRADLEGALEELVRACGQRKSPGIVVKIETAQAVAALPDLLLAALRRVPVGVMIARGDLAVEIGFERLAEVQQEILWFAEAAHLPVVWATQVLDGLASTGFPSRAEVTDASMSVQAECVMLNKGPFVTDACRTLERILHRMEAHQFKKRSLYRPLRISALSQAS